MLERQQPFRLTAALVTSAAAHAVALLLIVRSPQIVASLVGPEPPPEAKLFHVSLVSRTGGGGGGPRPGAPSPPPLDARDAASPSQPLAAPKPSPPPPPLPLPSAQARPPAVATPSPTAVASLRALAAPIRVPPRAVPTAPAAPAASGPTSASSSDHLASLGTGSGGGGGGASGGAGTGDGSGGDGSDALARPAYGSNPKPPYPLAARRLGVEGVVTLEVLVRPDGSPAEVRVQSSSGSPLLDESALDTVRTRWRFLPARRGNIPVESRVTFPVRFRLSEG
jgi:protein TonB